MSEFENRIDLKLLNEKVDKIKTEARKALVGQDKMLDLILVALLAEGHVLIEGPDAGRCAGHLYFQSQKS